MTDLKTHLNSAGLGDEPPMGFTPADVISAAHRVRRRRRGIYTAVTVGAAAAVAAGAVLALPGAGGRAGTAPGSPAPSLSLAALTRTAATRPAAAASAPGTARVDGVSPAQVIVAAEKAAGTELTSVNVSILAPSGELDLAAALAVPGSPYINVQVMPPHTLSTIAPTCAALSDAASGTGDGYHGPCSVQRLSDGSFLVTRSGQAASGSSYMAQAILVRANGSGAFAEDTNTAAPTRQEIAKIKARGGNLPAGHGQPPVNSAALAGLVRALTSDTRS